MNPVRLVLIAGLFSVSMLHPSNAFANEATFNARLTQTELRLSTAIQAGLNPGLAKQAKVSLNNVKQKYRDAMQDGSLVPVEEQMLNEMLNIVDSQIGAAGSSPVVPTSVSTTSTGCDPGVLNSRLSNLQRRVQSSIRSGQINRADAPRIMADVDTVRTKLRDCMADGSLIPAEEQMLNGMMNNIESAVNAGSSANYVPPASGNQGNLRAINSRLSALQQRVQSSIRSGAVSPAIGTDVDLVQSKIRDCMADGSLVPAEEQMLNDMMTQIDTKLNTATSVNASNWNRSHRDDGDWDRHRRDDNDWDRHGHGRKNGWDRPSNPHYDGISAAELAELNSRKARLGQRISGALANGDISRRAADRLQQGLTRIDSMQSQMQADGVISRTDSDQLDQELNRLSDSVRKELRDGR